MNNWAIILKAYQNGKFDKYFYGLTPRLIVGGCQIPLGKAFKNEEIAYNNTKNIIEEMRCYNKEGIIVSSNFCEIHNGPVLKFIEEDWKEGLFGTTFEIIWNRFGDDIIKGNYGIDEYDRQVLKTIF
jgi:hypothetical protein